MDIENGKAPEYSCELTQLYLAEGYPTKAIETLRRAKSKNPNDNRVLLGWETHTSPMSNLQKR